MSNPLVGASRVFAQTDGMDKLIKFMVGVFAVAGTTPSLQREQFLGAAKQLRDVRSLLRFGRLFALLLKLNSLVELFAAQGFVWTERKKFVEFLKVVSDFFYAACDHVLLASRAGLLGAGVDTARLYRCNGTVRLCSHVLGTIFNLFELRDAARRLEYDPPAAQRACKVAAIGVTCDLADTMVTLSVLSYAGSAARLSPRTEGALTCLSGGLATYLNWMKSA